MTMREIRDAEIRDAGLRSGIFPLRDIHNRMYVSCLFDNCSNVLPRSPGKRLQISDIELIDCSNRGCSINGAVIENVLVHNLHTHQRHVLFLWACVFRHVTLSGKIGSLKINQRFVLEKQARNQVDWDQANRKYYSDVDWALDITDAEFSFGPNLEAIPGHLIRRDADTQILVSRARVSLVDLENLEWHGSSLKLALEWFLEDSLFDDVVLVAPKRGSSFGNDMKALKMLRREGFVVDN
jgi:hypothetical protein